MDREIKRIRPLGVFSEVERALPPDKKSTFLHRVDYMARLDRGCIYLSEIAQGNKLPRARGISPRSAIVAKLVAESQYPITADSIVVLAAEVGMGDRAKADLDSVRDETSLSSDIVVHPGAMTIRQLRNLQVIPDERIQMHLPGFLLGAIKSCLSMNDPRLEQEDVDLTELTEPIAVLNGVSEDDIAGKRGMHNAIASTQVTYYALTAGGEEWEKQFDREVKHTSELKGLDIDRGVAVLMGQTARLKDALIDVVIDPDSPVYGQVTTILAEYMANPIAAEFILTHLFDVTANNSTRRLYQELIARMNIEPNNPEFVDMLTSAIRDRFVEDGGITLSQVDGLCTGEPKLSDQRVDLRSAISTLYGLNKMAGDVSVDVSGLEWGSVLPSEGVSIFMNDSQSCLVGVIFEYASVGKIGIIFDKTSGVVDWTVLEYHSQNLQAHNLFRALSSVATQVLARQAEIVIEQDRVRKSVTSVTTKPIPYIRLAKVRPIPDDDGHKKPKPRHKK